MSLINQIYVFFLILLKSCPFISEYDNKKNYHETKLPYSLKITSGEFSSLFQKENVEAICVLL